MIETMLDDLRKSFRETQRNGGFYGLSAQSGTLSAASRSSGSTGGITSPPSTANSLSSPKPKPVETVGKLYAELQALREETARPALALVA
jgi:hypothetical protein